MNTLRNYLDERQIHDSLRQNLFALSPDAQEIVADIIRALRPSANTLRDILRLGEEICLRDGTTWGRLFSEGPARNALAPGMALGAKDRAKELKRFLERKRFPETSAIEAKLEKCRTQLRRDVGLSVETPQDLEGDSVSLTLRFHSPEELAPLAEQSMKLAGHPALAQIFQLLKGQA